MEHHWAWKTDLTLIGCQNEVSTACPSLENSKSRVVLQKQVDTSLKPPHELLSSREWQPIWVSVVKLVLKEIQCFGRLIDHQERKSQDEIDLEIGLLINPISFRVKFDRVMHWNTWKIPCMVSFTPHPELNIHEMNWPNQRVYETSKQKSRSWMWWRCGWCIFSWNLVIAGTITITTSIVVVITSIKECTFDKVKCELLVQQYWPRELYFPEIETSNFHLQWNLLREWKGNNAPLHKYLNWACRVTPHSLIFYWL